LSQYTGKDHIAAAFKREYTDRVPSRVIQGLAPGLPLCEVTPREIRTQPEKFVEVMAALHRVVPSDAASILIEDAALFAEAAGIKAGLTRQEVASRTQKAIPLIQEESDLAHWELPDLARGERLPYFLDICRLASRELAGTAIDPMVSAPWTTAISWRGMENLIYDTVDDPQFVHGLLDYAARYTRMVAESLLETGISTLTLVDPSASLSVLTPDMFRTWVKPRLQETIQYLRQQKKVPVILHICGYLEPILTDIVSIGADGISVDQLCSLERLIEVSQRKAVIIGNVSTLTFLEGTGEDMERAVADCIETGAEGSGYILCSGCTVPDNAPLENIRHFAEFAQSYGAEYMSRLRKAKPELFAAG
jgi:uroporphyrinogen decarboxylase